jgi:hypothetical protein
MPPAAYGHILFPTGMDHWTKTAPWMGAGVGILVAGTWILRTAVVLHNKKIAREEELIAVPSWHYAVCVVFVTLLTDASLGGGLVAAMGQHHLIDALLLAVALRLLIHAAVLSWLLSSGFRAAMVVQVFEIAIAMTLAPVVGSVAVVVLVS